MRGEFESAPNGPTLEREVLQRLQAYQALKAEYLKQCQGREWSPEVEEWRLEVLDAGDAMLDLLDLLITSEYSSEQQRMHAEDDREEIIQFQHWLAGDEDGPLRTEHGRFSAN